MKIPSLISVEAELVRRGISPADDSLKAIPTEGDAELPPVVREADKVESKFRLGFIRNMEKISRGISIKELVEALNRGAVTRLINKYTDNAFKEILLPDVKEWMREAFMRGAKVAGNEIGVTVKAPANISFDLVNDLAVEWAEENGGNLVTEISVQQQATVGSIVSEATAIGRTTTQIATDLKQFIGLHSRQLATLNTYRAELIAQGLSEARIESLMSKRAKGMIARRARTIARTEVINSANSGQLGLWDEAVKEGLLDKTKTLKVWITTPDDLAEIYCVELDDVAVPLGEKFISGLGNVDAPTLHPNCRCGMKLRFKR